MDELYTDERVPCSWDLVMLPNQIQVSAPDSQQSQFIDARYGFPGGLDGKESAAVA